MIRNMLTNKERYWKASDFMCNNDLFIGYSASARMSEAKKVFPELFIEKYDGRFRAMKINENYFESHKKEILDYISE